MSNTLIIDSGSYSVKFIEGKFIRKNFKIHSTDEVLIDDVRDPNDINTTLEEYQQKIIHQFLEQTGFAGKIINQLPNDFITTRFLDLPISNKKKAEQMIPFQLDEDLPFPTSEAHYINTFHKNTNGNFSAIVEISEQQVFSDYHNFLQNNHTLPTVLTSELSVYQSYIEDRKFGGHICILDIGHETTKAYFAFNDKILANHTSSIAGKTLDEVIAQTYEIDKNDSRIYKHENAFFLTEGQLEQVTENQKEFAILMRQTCNPLVQQIHRWLLGYRIKTGFSIEKIFITGGTANIKNLDNFLTEKLEIPVEKLNILSLETQLNPGESNSLTLPFLMGQSGKYKNPPHSFLTKNFASGLSNGVKMEDTAFTFYRIAILCFLLAGGLIAESVFFIQADLKKKNRSITKVLKGQDLNLTNKQKRYFKKKPEKVSSILATKHKVIKADLKTLSKRQEPNALKHLAYLSQQIKKNDRVSLVEFDSNGSLSKALFEGDSKRDINQLKELIKTLNFNDLDLKAKGENSLEISFSGF